MSPRKDARENRARLVAAAREVFAEQGMAATLDDVAARAGVGVGTAYRNFRDKHELAAEVLGDATDELVADARDALAVEDPWEAVVHFFVATAARQARDRGLYQALAGQGRASDKARAWPELVASLTEVFERAHRAGAVRPDVQAEDAVAILAMVAALYDRPGEVDVWPRYLALVLDGLRAVDRPPLPGAADRYGSLDDVIAVTKRAR